MALVSNLHSVLDVRRHRALFLLLLTLLLRPTSPAVLPAQQSASLYTANDKVVILTGHNFTSTVYQSKTAWLIEFYASWCGHCQSYANTYREVAIDTWGWKAVVRIGAINCYAEENSATCDQHAIQAYPTLRLIAPDSPTNVSKVVRLATTDAKGVEKELIKELDALQRNERSWPNFAPINRVALEDIYSHAPPTAKLVLLVIENRDDFTGRQVMLDFSRYYEQLTIFRTTVDGKLWLQFQLNTTDLPALLIIHPNSTTERMNTVQSANENIGSRNLFNYAIRSYVHQRKCLDNFDDRDLEEIIVSKNALKSSQAVKKSEEKAPSEVAMADAANQKLSMVDLETALSYMLRREIPRMKEIQSEAYDALLHWLTVLTKYFPGRPPVVTFLKDLLSKVTQQSNGLTGQQFRALADTNTPTSYLPNNQIRYQHCIGSSPQYREYPCGLWVLFHTLTVSQVQTESPRKHITEVPSAIKNFIKYFFGCRHCSDNFMQETSDLHQLDPKDKRAAVAYLWKIHNHVNRRLHGDETEDPKHPKVQFPSAQLCPKCRSSGDDFDIPLTVGFLLRYYSKENLDVTSVGNYEQVFVQKEPEKPAPHRKASIDQYTMIEINTDTTRKSGLVHFLVSAVRRFPFYFLVSILILAFVARRRICKSKRKRYTL